MDMTARERKLLIVGLAMALQELDPTFKVNTSELARQANISRPTAYETKRRVIAGALRKIREVKPGRPAFVLRDQTADR